MAQPHDRVPLFRLEHLYSSIEQLNRSNHSNFNFNIQHNIVLAGCSWVVGAIERLNREVLATARVMLSEFQLSHTEWRLVRIMQSALNSNPLPSLNELSPQEFLQD